MKIRNMIASVALVLVVAILLIVLIWQPDQAGSLPKYN